MTPEDLQHSLTVAGVTCRLRRGEVVVEVCRFCGNERWNLELNATLGVFHCWSCNEGGRLDRILTDWLGYAVHIPISFRLPGWLKCGPATRLEPFASMPATELGSAFHYLSRRGITREVIHAYDIVVCAEPGHQLEHRIVIPAPDFWTGEILGYIGRTYTHQHPKYISTLARRVVVGYPVRNPITPCVIVEGLFDGMAVHRAGFHAAVLLGTHAPGVMEFAARLIPETPIVIMLDSSAEAEARKLYWGIRALRHAAVELVILPNQTDPANFHPPVLKRVVQKALKGFGTTTCESPK